MSAGLAPIAGAGGTPTDPLAALRPYHLPDVPSWWPPAPGWWLLALSVLLALVLLFVWWWRRRKRRAAARAALQALQGLREQLREQQDQHQFVRELSKLLRRYAITIFPRHRVAGLAGEDWLRFLDQQGGNGRFVDGPGRQLLEAPYAPSKPLGSEPLAKLAEQWIARNREPRQ